MIKLSELLFESGSGGPRPLKKFRPRGPQGSEHSVADLDDPYDPKYNSVTKSKTNEADSETSSAASDEAKRLGLEYLYFGRYGKNGQVTHVSKDGKLVPFDPAVHKEPALANKGRHASPVHTTTPRRETPAGRAKRIAALTKSGSPVAVAKEYKSITNSYPHYKTYDKLTDAVLKKVDGDTGKAVEWVKSQYDKYPGSSPDAQLRQHGASGVALVLKTRMDFKNHSWLWGQGEAPEMPAATQPYVQPAVAHEYSDIEGIISSDAQHDEKGRNRYETISISHDADMNKIAQQVLRKTRVRAPQIYQGIMDQHGNRTIEVRDRYLAPRGGAGLLVQKED